MNVEKSNLIKGSLLVTCGFFCMAVFGILTKVAYDNVSGIWVSFITYAAGTLLLLPLVLSKGLNFLHSDHFKYHFLRAAFGCSASFLYMLSMHYIPIVNATLLFNTAPIFLPILAIFFMNEKVTWFIWLAIFLGFIGIMIIIKPNEEIFKQYGDLIGLASGICLAIAYLMIKLLSATDPSLRIVFYYFFISLILQIPLLFFAGNIPPLKETLFAALAGLSLLSAQFFIVEGYKLAPVSKVGVFQYTSVVFVALLEWMLWKDVPDLSDLLGFLLVATAGYFIIRSRSSEPAKIDL